MSFAADQGKLSTEEESIHEAARMLLMSDSDTRGTVAALSQEIDEFTVDSKSLHKDYLAYVTGNSYHSFTVGIRFSLGDATKMSLPLEDQSDLLEYYHNTFPDAAVIACSSDFDLEEPNFLISRGLSHKHLILDGRHLLPSESLTKAHSSIIQADFDGVRYVGQVVKIFSHDQPDIPNCQHLVSVHWFKRLEGFDTSHWDP